MRMRSVLDEQLDELHRNLIEQGVLVSRSIESAIHAFNANDKELGKKVVEEEYNNTLGIVAYKNNKKVYEEYFKKAKKDNAKVIRMYTESYNTPSRNLANSLGFSLASTYGNMEITLENVEDTNMDFSLVSNMDELHLEKMKENWDRFISLNRSFFEINTDNLKWMIDKKMVYKNGDNIVIFGARMLGERGLFLGFVSGDLESGVKFAMEKSNKLGSNKLTCIFPVDNLELKRVLEKLGFKNIYDLFVMEKNM